MTNTKLIFINLIYLLICSFILKKKKKKKFIDTDSEVEEYLPEATGEALAFLQLAGNAQIKDDDSRESTTHGKYPLSLY